MSVVATAAPGPTESSSTIGMRYANAGMICIASSTGVIARWTRSERPAAMPTGTPIASESATEANVSAKVRMLASQTPSAANDTNAAAVPSAARRPPKRSTTAVPSAAVPTHVSLKKKLVSQPTMSSRKVATPLNTTKKTLGCGTLRRSLSQVWKLSRSCESDCHVSPPGHGTLFFQPKYAISIPTTTPTTMPARPPRAGARPGRSPSVALAGDGREDGLAVDDADDAVAVDRADRTLARSDHRDCGPHGRRDVEPRAVELAVDRVAHDPAQREHVAARDVAGEVGDVVVRRRADEVFRRPELHDRAVAHDRDPVAEPQRLRQVVRDEDHRLARLPLEADHLVLHVAADERIERAERLVVQHHLRVDGERAGKTDALLHPAGELV